MRLPRFLRRNRTLDERAIANGVRRSWELAESIDLAQSFAASHPLRVNEGFRDVLLSSESEYVDIYIAGCEGRHYNFILQDFSFFQFSIEGEAVRYAYFPNPFEFEPDGEDGELISLVSSGSATEDEYLQILSDRQLRISKPAIRFEHNPMQYREVSHPCSHFHIGFHYQDRWAVEKVLTPFAFTGIVFRLYYRPYWQTHDNDSEFGNELDRQLADERSNCRAIGDDFFSSIERRLFHFS